MQSNDVIEVVASFGGGISDPGAAAVLAGTAKCFGGTGSDFPRRRTASTFA
jgi:hypothetical protein